MAPLWLLMGPCIPTSSLRQRWLSSNREKCIPDSFRRIGPRLFQVSVSGQTHPLMEVPMSNFSRRSPGSRRWSRGSTVTHLRGYFVVAMLFIPVTAIFSATPASAAEEVQIILFGPREYVRTSGPPQTHETTFAAPPHLHSPFQSIVAADHVSSARIILNNMEVVSPASFNQHVTTIVIDKSGQVVQLVDDSVETAHIAGVFDRQWEL